MGARKTADEMATGRNRAARMISRGTDSRRSRTGLSALESSGLDVATLQRSDWTSKTSFPDLDGQ